MAFFTMAFFTMAKFLRLEILLVHVLHPHGHKQPTNTAQFHTHVPAQGSKNKVFKIFYMANNHKFIEVVKLLAKSDISISYGRNDMDKELAYRYLEFGKFREITITIHSGAVDSIVRELNGHGWANNPVYINPESDDTVTTDNSFEITSPHYIPFPQEVALLCEKFKNVELIQKGKFKASPL